MASGDQTHYLARLNRLREIARTDNLDVIALVPGANSYYITGAKFKLGSRPTVMFIPANGSDPVLAIPTLEIPLIAGREPYPIRMVSYTDAEGYTTAFEKVCAEFAGKRIGVEGMTMRVTEGQAIEKYAPGSTLIAAENIIAELRIRKDTSEVDEMRKAIKISEDALADVISEVRPGMTERSVMQMLVTAIAERGGQEDAFPPIVLTGANSAQPHGSPGEAVIREGDLLLFDFGTKVNGYPSDITRTFAIGKVSDELKRIYEVVLAANEAGIRVARPGIAAQDVDRAARKVIEDAGYGEYFLHRTGHGLGLDVHEAPNMREGNTQILEPGMIFTVEPGVYVQGLGGVRIEDNILITDNGAEVLTSFPKAFRVLGA
jgi:Xaa-Pro dipeptidase